MSSNFQLIPFQLPEYLSTYFAHQLKAELKPHNNHSSVIEITRYSVFGKQILSLLEASPKPLLLQQCNLFLKISNWSGNNYDIPRGDHHFLTLKPSHQKKLKEQIKTDFEESLIRFVSGAEFAHRENGWTPDKKRKGIRKKSILKFCEDHNVNFSKENLERFVKMIQRAANDAEKRTNTRLKKYNQNLSY